jgi:hypothetical protein
MLEVRRDLVYRASAAGSLYRSPLAIMTQNPWHQRNAEPVDPAIRTTHLGRSIVECELLIGTRSAEGIMASGHVNRIKRPNTWLHRPMLQNVKKLLPTRSRLRMTRSGNRMRRAIRCRFCYARKQRGRHRKQSGSSQANVRWRSDRGARPNG